jgi:hypothetical protein
MSEDADRTVMQSDSHIQYCAGCRSTYGFPWGNPPTCSCTQAQDLPVLPRRIDSTHQESGTDLRETLRFLFFHTLLDNWPTPVLISDRQIQHIVAITNKLIDVVDAHGTHE